MKKCLLFVAVFCTSLFGLTCFVGCDKPAVEPEPVEDPFAIEEPNASIFAPKNDVVQIRNRQATKA